MTASGTATTRPARGRTSTARVSRPAVVGLLALALVGSAGVERTAAADRVARSPVALIELEGTIGNSLAVHMRLEVRDVVRGSGASADVVGEDYSGHYAYDRVGRRIALRGRFNAQGMDGAADDPTIEIAEFVDGRKTGVFIGKLDERRFHGHWESFDPPKRLPFDLRVVRRLAP